MQAMLVDKLESVIYIGDVSKVEAKVLGCSDRSKIEVYKQQNLVDLNRLVPIVETYYEIKKVELI